MALTPPTRQKTQITGDTSTILKPKTSVAYTKPAARILDLRMFVSVARKHRRVVRSSAGSPGKQWPAVQQWRRVVGKVSKSLPSVTWKGHGYYIQRERANEDRSCFDREVDAGVNAAVRLEEWQHQGDSHITKITVSPEYTEGLDVKEYTRRFIRELEADHKTKFEWVAAVHTNTSHPHVHVVIRSIAANGRAVDFSRDYIRDRVSTHACSVATELVGMDMRQRDRGRDREQERQKDRA